MGVALGVEGELEADELGFFKADLSGLACSEGSFGPCALTQPVSEKTQLLTHFIHTSKNAQQ